MNQKKLFENEKTIKEKNIQPKQAHSILESLKTEKDCKFRDGQTCSKTGKQIVLDARGEKTKCWNQLYCDYFEK